MIARILVFLIIGALAACALPGAGPSASEIVDASKPTEAGQTRFALIEVDPGTVDKMEHWAAVSLQGTFGQQGRYVPGRLALAIMFRSLSRKRLPGLSPLCYRPGESWLPVGGYP